MKRMAEHGLDSTFYECTGNAIRKKLYNKGISVTISLVLRLAVFQD
jgi:hypothetical protein